MIGVKLMYDWLMMLRLLLDDGTHFETALFVPADEVYVVEYHDTCYGLFDLAESPSIQLANKTHKFTLGIKILGQHLLLEYFLIANNELIILRGREPFEDAFARRGFGAVLGFVFDHVH